MAEIPVVIDTNLWSDLRLILSRLKEKSGKSYKDIWTTLEADPDFIKNTLTIDEQKNFRAITNTMKMLMEMKNSQNKYVVDVPSFVYNEAGRSVSSKIASDATGSELYLQTFKDIVNSLPIKATVDDTILKQGIDYPEKTKETAGKNIETTMKDFLQNNKQATLNELIKHLRNADDTKKSGVQKRIQKIKNRMEDVLHKTQKWDQFMAEAAKVHGLPYETRTKSLSSLYGSIKKYRDVNKIFTKPDPVDIIAERLTMIDEEFDFFDLQIYLYAKDKNAHIITRNTQAYQEINDPSFLGYFEDVKVMHPLINFDSLTDLNNSGDLNEIIDRSIEKDFNEVDLQVCRELDKKLIRPILENKGGELIRAAEASYSPDVKRLKIDTALGNVLRVLRIENNQLKVSREFFFDDYNTNQVKSLQFIDKQFFNNQLSSDDFVRDNIVINKNRKYFLKSKVLADYLNSNPEVKAKLEQFQDHPGSYLDDFLTRYRGKTDLEIRNLYLALSIESHFSESEVEEGLGRVPDSETLSFQSCPPSGRKGKREASECLLEWEQIEEFNEERIHQRDPLKVKIDSRMFLEYIKTVKDPQMRSQLIEFADQVLNSAEDRASKISGSKVLEVTHLINNHKVSNHFSKVYRVSNALNYGIFAKSLLVDIVHGNIKGVAVNIGFMGGNYGFSRLATASVTKGVEYAEAGKVMLGNSLKYASPFIARFLSPLIALDLYNQIQALKAGDKDAIVGIVGDSVFLAIDAVDIGVSLLEISGLIGEISAVTGPIGVALGVLVMIGSDIYFAVRKVQKLDDIIHLTTGEKWQIGAGTFFSLGLAKFDVERLAHIKVTNNQLAKQALEAIQNNKDIQRIVIPSAVSKGSDDVEIAQDNLFVPFYESSNIKWDRVRPEDPDGGVIFCAPQGNWENPPRRAMAKCQDAIGVADLETKTKNYTLFNLGDGEDYVRGFKDSVNIFRIGKGKKQMTGGDRNDAFILEEGTTFRNFPEAFLDAGGGSNIFDFRGLKGDGNDAVAVYFREEPVEAIIFHVSNYTTREYRRESKKYLVLYRGKPVGAITLNVTVSTPRTYQRQKIKILGIDSIIGRENEVDLIYTNCTTKYVDSKGGWSEEPDRIYIPHTYKECNHEKIIQMGPNTVVKNEAVTGKFSYFVNDVHSNNNCTLKRSLPYRLVVIEDNHIDHKFFINATLSDIVKFEFKHEKNDYYDIDISMYFKDKKGNINRFHLDTVLGYGKNNGGMDNLMFYFKDNVQLGYHHNGIYALLKSNMSVPDIIKKYRPISIDFGISIFIYAENGDAMISIGSDQADDVLYNDPSFKTYLIGNKGNNFYTVISGRDVLQGPDPPIIPEIGIYSSGSQNHIDTLDLRPLTSQIKDDLGKQVLMKHVFDSEKLVLYLYTAGRRSYDITSITFRNIDNPPKWNSWCNNLHIILNKAPVVLKCNQSYQRQFGRSIDYKRDVINYDPSNYYTPLPLVFSDHEVIIIQEEDVEPYTEVIVKKNLVHNLFLRSENDLVMTNGFNFNTPAYHPTTIVVKDYYKNPTLFDTLKFTFNDKFVSFKIFQWDIIRAKTLEDYYNEYDKNSTNIIGSLPRRNRRDLGTITSDAPPNSSEVEQSQLSGRSFFGSVIDSVSNIYHTSLAYARDYYKYLVKHKPKLNFYPLQISKDDFSKGPKILNNRILESKPNVAGSNENNIAYTDVNSTLLLLDTLVRKLNDYKYKQPIEDDLLSPDEQVEKKVVELASKLDFDFDDIVGSIEKQQQRILDNLKEELSNLVQQMPFNL